MRGLIANLALISAGCADPISNQLFYEDALFVQALPGQERLAPPQVLLSAAVGPASLQQQAVEEAERVGNVFLPLALSADELRTTPPTTRTESFRDWAATPVVADGGAQWWARGEVRRPEGPDTTATWQIEWAADEAGPWTVMAIGQHTSPLTGTFAYFVDDDGTTRELGVRYGEEPSGQRSVELGVALGPVNGDVYWKIIGDSTLLWTGLFDVGLALPRPGAAMVVQDLDGGRGEGFTSGDDPVTFTSCWDTAGGVVYSVASDGSVEGDASRCVVEPLFE